MGRIIETSLKLVDDKVKLISEIPQKSPITTDYFPPMGTGDGYISLELLLVSFSSCVSTTLLYILKTQMKKTVLSFTADTKGTQKNEIPLIIEHITCDINIKSPDITDEDFKQALKTAEAICPVWNMLKGNTEIEVNYSL